MKKSRKVIAYLSLISYLVAHNGFAILPKEYDGNKQIEDSSSDEKNDRSGTKDTFSNVYKKVSFHRMG